MHILIGLLLVAVVGYVVYRTFLVPTVRVDTAPAARSRRGFAFLSNGLLFHRVDGDVKQVQSNYVQEAVARRERARDRHSWKEGTSFQIGAGGRNRSFEPGDKPIQATSAVFEPSGDLLYFLKDENVGGLFRQEKSTGRELRVLLKQNLHLSDLTLSPDGTTLAACSHHSGGIANIILVQSDGNLLREVTGGDTVDSAPAWIPGVANRLLFQSAGLARDANGYIIAQGHASIQKLDMESGSVTPIVDEPAFDFLKPRVCPSGNLHYIRRPYEAPAYGMGSALTDTLFFPFRLLRALFHYLNFFSLMYSRKPLTSASGPALNADIKDILLQGRRVDAEKAMRSARTVQGVPSLVPDNWELVRRDTNGNEKVLATNVASYDISPDGTIVYSNGRGVFVIERDGGLRLAVTDELVADVVAAAA
jgi:hypothetical protein